MAWSLLVHGSARNSGAGLLTMNTIGADFFAAFSAEILTSYAVPIDDQSNTWIPCIGYTDGVAFGKWWYVVNPTTNASHSFYPTNGGFNAQSLAVSAWSGANSSPLDQQNGTNNINPFPAYTMNPGSVTPTTNNQLILQGVAYRFTAAGPVSIDSGYTILDADNNQNQNIAAAYLIQGTAAASNPTWTFTGNDTGYGSMAVVTFKEASGGGSTWPGYQAPWGWHRQPKYDPFALKGALKDERRARVFLTEQRDKYRRAA